VPLGRRGGSGQALISAVEAVEFKHSKNPERGLEKGSWSLQNIPICWGSQKLANGSLWRHLRISSETLAN
jgi:hypothetical protein